MSTRHAQWLRLSLAAVWLGTAAVSLLDYQNAGSQLLMRGGIASEFLIHALIVGGSAVDLGLGLLLWLKPSRPTYLLALAMMALMTVVATCLLPALWLDPLGALLKNLPIAAILLALLQTEKPT